MATMDEIEKARQRLGVKPSTLSTMAGFSPQAYGKALRGEFRFRQENLNKLHRALEQEADRQEAQAARLRRLGREAA